MAESINSSGTLYYPGMETDSSVSEKSSLDGAALLRELTRVRTILAARAATEGGFSLSRGESLLVVARFVPGLTPEGWRALLQEQKGLAGGRNDLSTPENTAAKEEDWVALALDPAEHPQLMTLSKDGAHLFHAVCPLTGALLPRFFRQHMGGALRQATGTGSDLSLIVLEIVPPASMKKRRTDTVNETEISTETYPNEVFVPFPESPLDAPLCALARLVRTHARFCDTLGRLAVDRLGLLLPGSGPFRARALAERIIGDFNEMVAAEQTSSPSPGGDEEHFRLKAGIACCDGDVESADALLRHVGTALSLAQAGYTRTFRKTGTPAPERKTQVQACEKQFLFFGDTE